MNDFKLIWDELSLISRSSVATEADLVGLASEHSETLTTGDVAELIGIHPSTVKRWFRGAAASASVGGARAVASDEPAGPGTGLRVSKTAGGHRRISLTLALRVARERGHEVYLHGFGADAGPVWRAVQALDSGDPEPAQQLLIDWLKAGRTRPIGRFLRHVTGLGGPGEAPRAGEVAVSARRAIDARILDGVFGGFMQRVGDGWARGDLPIRAERAASREVSETIHALLDRARHEERRVVAARLDDSGHTHAHARPTAVVATVEPEQHLLGSLLVRLMLVQRGWRVEHLGTGLPVAEIVATQQATEASLVCVSFTPPRGTADVRRFVDVAGRLADRCSPYSLVLGGGGARGVDLCGCQWPFGSPEVLSTLAGFGQWLDGPDA